MFSPSRLILTLALSMALNAPVRGQRPVRDSTRDTTKVIHLGEIVVREAGGRTLTAVHTEQRLSLATIRRADASVVADLARLVPAAYVQTNSRGETLVYLRNAGERQVAVFFEGALLNIPWDNRVDVSLIPAGMVGGMTVAEGVPPVEYGANVLGGAVNFTARRPEGEYHETSLAAGFGSQRRWRGTARHLVRSGRLSFSGSASFARSDGNPVPDDASLPFSQPPNTLRTNTDSRVANVFASGTWDLSRSARVGLSVMYMDAAKGVAPESHLDPAVSRVRFWRYPDWRYATAIIHGEGMSSTVAWRGALWMTRFDQAIDAYASDRYRLRTDREEDDDRTIGSRMVITRALGPGVGKVALNALTSTHRQRDIAFDNTGRPIPGVNVPRLRFRQHLVSLGSEYSLPVRSRVSVTVGGSIDAMFMPLTGDKPDRDPITTGNLTLGARYRPPEGVGVRMALGRKTRFPTMRELFGTALNRFLVNPILAPESSWLVEVGVDTRGSRLSGEVIPFARFTSNTIDQRSVRLPDESRSRRQRINIRGSRVLGVELIATAEPWERISLQGHLTVMHVRRRRDAPADPDRLTEKPAVLGRLGAEYHSLEGSSFLLEAVYTGRAWSLDDNNALVPLPTSLVLNLRAGHEVDVSSWQTLRLFVRVENLTDTVVVPQLGLPDPGRVASGGVEVTF